MNIRNVAIVMIVCACALCGGMMLSCDDSDSGGKGPSKLVLFGTNAMYTGNLGGRAGADAKCAADANRPADLSHIRAFISVTTDDCIANMPDNYNFPDNVPIVAPDGITVIADNWADLLDGSIDVSLGVADVLDNAKGNWWWSGSNDDGTLAGDNCSAWTNGNGVMSGEIGEPILITSGWISIGSTNSDFTGRLLGLAY